MNFMGFNAMNGAGLGATVDAFQKTSGVDLTSIVTALTSLKDKKEEKIS